MNTTENTTKSLVQIVDNISDLKFFLEKVDVLSYEISTDYLDRINFKTEKGRLTAEYDLNIARVKSEVVCNYITQAVNMTEKLLKQSNDTLESLSETK